eukprot:2542685-Prymnesium_polylepis.1
MPPPWPLCVTSVNEDRFLKIIGMGDVERSQIEGLQSSQGVPGMTEEKLSSRAILLLASNPPPGVGRMQNLTSKSLLRPYPLGLRTSGKNMNPLPCWLAGAQGACRPSGIEPKTTRRSIDLAAQLHFALFKGAAGYVLKPPEMISALRSSGDGGGEEPHTSDLADSYWPPPRDMLHVATMEIFSLHALPKV